MILLKWCGIVSWICWGVLASQKINNIGCAAQGHVQKSRKHENEGFQFFHNQIEKLLVQNEAEYFYGAFKHIFPWIDQNGHIVSNMFSYDSSKNMLGRALGAFRQLEIRSWGLGLVIGIGKG